MRTTQAAENPMMSMVSSPKNERANDTKSSAAEPFGSQLNEKIKSAAENVDKSVANEPDSAEARSQVASEASDTASGEAAAAENQPQDDQSTEVEADALPAVADQLAGQLMALLAMQQIKPTVEAGPSSGETPVVTMQDVNLARGDAIQDEGTVLKDEAGKALPEAVFAGGETNEKEKFAVLSTVESRRAKVGVALGHGDNGAMPVSQATSRQEVVHAPTQHGVSVKVEAAVGSTAWGQEIGQKVVLMVGGKQQTLEMQLNPPQLGPLEVKLTLNQDQASVSFITAHGQVREALLQTVPKLGEMLADNGVMLANVQVDVGGSGRQPAFAQQSASGQYASGGRSDEDGQEVGVRVGSARLQGLPGQVSLFV